MRDDFDIAAFDPHPAFRIKRARSHALPVRHLPPRNANVWPLPTIAGRAPTLKRKDDGVLLGYEEGDDVLPAFVPVHAVSDGVVVYAGTALGVHAITVDHGDQHRSFYSGITHAFVMPTSRYRRAQRVNAGDVLGYIASTAPNSAALHFTLMSYDEAGRFRFLDAPAAMESWTRLPWADSAVARANSQPIAA